jgi:hypothetical protein
LDLLEPLGRLLPESLPQMAVALGHPDELVRRAAYRHLEGFIDRSHAEPGGDRSLQRLVDHLGGIQPELPVTGQLLLTGLLSRTLAVLVSQPAAEGGELAVACQNLMDAAHGRLRANRRVMYQVDNLATSLAPPLAPLPALTTHDDTVQESVRDTAALTELRSVAAPADSVAIGRDFHALGHGNSGGERARVAVSDPPGLPQGGEGGGAVDSASPSSSRPTTRSGSTASRLGGAGQVATISLKAGTGAKLINAPDPSAAPQPLDLALEDRDRLSGDLPPLASVPVRTARPAAPDEWPSEWPEMGDPPPISSEPSAVRWEPRGERAGGVQSSGSGRGVAPEGMEQLSESDLVRLLGSVRPALVSAAEQQLMQRGWSGRLVRIAGTLASGETEAKLLALDQLLSEPGVKATPWLMWMAEDGEPHVRRAAVERLARLGDPEVLRRVRLLLGREADAEVRGAMQRVLISGGANPQEIR